MFQYAFLKHGSPQNEGVRRPLFSTLKTEKVEQKYGTFEHDYEKFPMLVNVVDFAEDEDEHEDAKILDSVKHIFQKWDFEKRHSFYRVLCYSVCSINGISLGGRFTTFVFILSRFEEGVWDVGN